MRKVTHGHLGAERILINPHLLFDISRLFFPGRLSAEEVCKRFDKEAACSVIQAGSLGKLT